MHAKTGRAHQAADAAPPTLPPATAHGQQQQRSADPGAAAPSLSAALLTPLLMHLPCGVIVVDMVGSVVFMNEAGTRLSHELLLGDSSVAGSALPDQPGEWPAVTHGMLIAVPWLGTPCRMWTMCSGYRVRPGIGSYRWQSRRCATGRGRRRLAGRCSRSQTLRHAW